MGVVYNLTTKTMQQVATGSSSSVGSALRDSVVVLRKVSLMEEFRVGTERTSQVLENIQQLLALQGPEEAKLHALLVVLGKKVNVMSCAR